MTKRKTKNERVLNYLLQGHDLTEGQARSRFGIQNMSAEATRLRQKGYAVYNNQRTLSNGNRANVYRIGTPRRSVVAAGYALLGAN